MTMIENDGNTQPTRFFDQGLRFECRQCGTCCTGDPGTVYVTAEEVRAIARHIDMGEEDLIRQCLYPFKDSFSIKEKQGGNCYFFNQGCAIYAVRPMQCRTFPFWFDNLRSENAWRKTLDLCPGIGRGRLHTKAEILASIHLTTHL